MPPKTRSGLAAPQTGAAQGKAPPRKRGRLRTGAAATVPAATAAAAGGAPELPDDTVSEVAFRVTPALETAAQPVTMADVMAQLIAMGITPAVGAAGQLAAARIGLVDPIGESDEEEEEATASPARKTQKTGRQHRAGKQLKSGRHWNDDPEVLHAVPWPNQACLNVETAMHPDPDSLRGPSFSRDTLCKPSLSSPRSPG